MLRSARNGKGVRSAILTTRERSNGSTTESASTTLEFPQGVEIMWESCGSED